MILILTTQAGDFSHLKIIDWLTYYGADFTIMTGEGILSGDFPFTIKNGEIIYDNINLSECVSCVFCRRWYTSSQRLEKSGDRKSNIFENQLNYEANEIKRYLFKSLKSAVWFPNPEVISVNKLFVLSIAKKYIDVPDYIVTNKRSELCEFFVSHNGKVITKAIGNFSPFYTSTDYLINPIYTKLISDDIIHKLPESFCLSLFQERIDKVLEYRVFYFDGEVYPTAIISQENTLTTVDSRRNNSEIECRLLPAVLDNKIKEKITKFMNELNLNIGSIDLILSQDDKFYFLEVNPVGQIGGYSRRCGYNLEKIIAKKLCQLDRS